MHVARLFPAAIRRAFSLMGMRLRALFGEAPVLFFVVVLGVALTFRAGAGLAREASALPVVAPPPPTFVASGPEPGVASGFVPQERPAGTTSGLSPTATAEVGAAAKVQPIGLPSPPRVAPRPRGHGRHPLR